MKKCWDQTTEVMFSRLGRRRRGSTLLHLLLCNAVNTLLSGLLRLKRARDYVLDFTKHELCWEDDINKAQTLLSPLLPSFFFTKHFSFSFGVNELEGKIVKASKIPDYTSTHFSLRLNQMNNLGLSKHRHEKQCWLLAILPAQVHCQLWK